MCGRYKMSKPTREVAETFHVTSSYEIAPRYNVAPTDLVPAVRLDDTGARELVPVRWGLIPFWAKDVKIGSSMINARAESVFEKPAFRNALQKRRCLVVADGFYEWRAEGKKRQPFLFRLRSERLFAFAGLYERWKGPEGLVESCSVITTTANALLAPVHDRMPVILDDEEAWRAWLDPAREVETLAEFFAPLDAEEMEAVAVGPRVGNVKNDDAACAAPAPLHQTLFD